MFPPQQGLRLDLTAISGILGSISIACWVVVFSPQILENFRRSSADGLSIVFLVIWLAGDVFNILGAVLQGVLPTMIILAVYYTFADIVLIAQCFYYRGFTLSDAAAGDGAQKRAKPVVDGVVGTDAERGDENLPSTERTPLLNGESAGLRDRIPSMVDGTHLSPVTPLRDDTQYDANLSGSAAMPSPTISSTSPTTDTESSDDDRRRRRTHRHTHPRARRRRTTLSALRSFTVNLGAVLLVCAAGVFGWWLSERHKRRHSAYPQTVALSPAPQEEEEDDREELYFNLWGQIFGYVCAALYLGSRLPQLLLNYRRKSTEGISMLFFVFACVGNLTYVLSILAYEPPCGWDTGYGDHRHRHHHHRDRVPDACDEAGEAWRQYGWYVLVNLSWLLGSFGTLLLDAAVFVQFFLYRTDEVDENAEDDVDEARAVAARGGVGDERAERD